MLAPFDVLTRLHADRFRPVVAFFLTMTLLNIACDEKTRSEGERVDQRGVDAALDAPDLSATDSGLDASQTIGYCADTMLRGGLVEALGAPSEDELGSKTQIHGALAALSDYNR